MFERTSLSFDKKDVSFQKQKINNFVQNPKIKSCKSATQTKLEEKGVFPQFSKTRSLQV